MWGSVPTLALVAELVDAVRIARTLGEADLQPTVSMQVRVLPKARILVIHTSARKDRRVERAGHVSFVVLTIGKDR